MTGLGTVRADRGRLLRGAALATLAAIAALGLQGQAALAQDTALNGVWRIEKPVDAVRTSEGEAPPLTPQANRAYQAHLSARKRGDTSFDSTTWCAAAGTPRMMLMNSPFEIVVNDPYIAFLHEWNWWARIVYLFDARANQPAQPQELALPGTPGAGAGPPTMPPPGGPEAPGDAAGGPPPLPGLGMPGGAMPELSDPNGPMGISTGKWEGKTLVIETTNLRPTTLIDNSGLPHGERLTITERLTLRGPDLLEDRIRFDDPDTFTRPWETVVTYRRDNHEIREDVCLDRIKQGEPAVR
ncbi:hypothetical protein WSK_2873 [Novosphingobium sp. Rr 2-17]|uniref:hypothetical protein n=1 Tax=Novosphingobium sp. Rr 2-17 TaxID=555793 RepID=UPI0002699EDD|nr:hypothetical protein [Novosphingobium sp. Rr 2-17]EIZ78825.1 hypothetical protein WSK_2873 [Novosphingobium sp. Rr 2-17]